MKDIVNNHIIDGRLKHKKERGKYFYASEAYLIDNPKDSKCARQLGYKIKGYKPTEDRKDMYPIFAIGDLYHDFIQKIFVKEKLATQIEEASIVYDDDGRYFWIRKDENKIIIKNPVEIHGRLDIKFKLDDQEFLADIKTVNERAWHYLQTKPKEAHYAQMQIYLHHLKEKGVLTGFLLYINKSTGEMKEFLIQYDEEYVLQYLQNYKSLFAEIMSNGLPKRIFKSGGEAPWQCHYCGFAKTCLGLSLEELEKKKYVSYPEEPDDGLH